MLSLLTSLIGDLQHSCCPDLITTKFVFMEDTDPKMIHTRTSKLPLPPWVFSSFANVFNHNHPGFQQSCKLWQKLSRVGQKRGEQETVWYVLKGAPSLGMLPLISQAEGACAALQGIRAERICTNLSTAGKVPKEATTAKSKGMQSWFWDKREEYIAEDGWIWTRHSQDLNYMPFLTIKVVPGSAASS